LNCGVPGIEKLQNLVDRFWGADLENIWIGVSFENPNVLNFWIWSFLSFVNCLFIFGEYIFLCAIRRKVGAQNDSDKSCHKMCASSCWNPDEASAQLCATPPSQNLCRGVLCLGDGGALLEWFVWLLGGAFAAVLKGPAWERPAGPLQVLLANLPTCRRGSEQSGPFELQQALGYPFSSQRQGLVQESFLSLICWGLCDFILPDEPFFWK